VHIYILDLIGVFAFAVFGSYKALEKRFNTYGIIACAALTALGGGTIRELILRKRSAHSRCVMSYGAA